jgi:hypothetical protein
MPRRMKKRTYCQYYIENPESRDETVNRDLSQIERNKSTINGGLNEYSYNQTKSQTTVK